MQDREIIWIDAYEGKRMVTKYTIDELECKYCGSPHVVRFGTVGADDGATLCAYGATMGAKKLKAIVVMGGKGEPGAADPAALAVLAGYLRQVECIPVNIP